MKQEKRNHISLWNLGYETIRELETEQGLLASGKEEIFGCIFGRDSLISALKLLKTYERTKDAYLLSLVKKILINLAALQGKTVNIESGEEPGKCIHEYRPTNHEHLTKQLTRPWYVYPDNAMRNYDTVDATPLLLMAIHHYYRLSRDEAFLNNILPNVHAALDWLLIYGDSNGDGFIDYRLSPERKHGGLRTQSWMDSRESLFENDENPIAYPVAPVEAQAYAYVALRAWAHHFKTSMEDFSKKLDVQATTLKNNFNEKFVSEENGDFSIAFAIDGKGKRYTDARSSIAHCLWAVWQKQVGIMESILETENIQKLVARIMAPDLFEPKAGIRTLSSRSPYFDPQSYHNGSIWPHDTAIVIEGLKNFGYKNEAVRIRQALLQAYRHFETPIELFVFHEGKYGYYLSPTGQGACKKQAWSAAALLAQSRRRVKTLAHEDPATLAAA